jgi:uncharacterized protein (TIGR03086 family)
MIFGRYAGQHPDGPSPTRGAPVLDLRPATREVARLLEGVTDDQLSAPSPSDCDVATLLDHLMGLTLAFTWAAEKSAAEHGPTGPGRSSAKALDPDWRSVLPGRLDALADAWSKPSAWEGMTEAGGVTMPGEVTGLVALDEVVLHGWDLARATGQEFSCDPANADAVLGFTERSAQPDQAAMRTGLFGPVVPVADDAPVFDRALGFAGRDPAWTA